MSAHTANTHKQDAVLLWSDATRLVSQNIGAQRHVAMMQACEPISLDQNLLTVSTLSSYAKHCLDDWKESLVDYLSKAAFQPMDLTILYEIEGDVGRIEYPELITQGIPEGVEWFSGSDRQSKRPKNQTRNTPADVIPFGIGQTTISEDEFRTLLHTTSEPKQTLRPAQKSKANPLVTEIADNDSKLTFENFVEGVENQFALAAAKQVANGNSTQYNPLFIYGNSGLGKTHLLMSIKNYLASNDPNRTCVYRIANDFINDYTSAMMGDKTIKDALTQHYRDVDVLILDDIQHLRGAANTVEFFFDTFNYLISNGKQIVLAADVSPAELGMSERITSRMGSGFEVSIQSPSLELKQNLVRTFYRRFKQESLQNNEGILSNNVLDVMAESSGGDIRKIMSFVQSALVYATQLERVGEHFTEDDARSLAKEKWPHGHHRVTIDEVQSMVEREMGINHADLIGSKRNKEIAQARHVAIWLCRQLTDHTYEEIGTRFGGRTHTTCLHSCDWVDSALKSRTDRALIETIHTLRRKLETL